MKHSIKLTLPVIIAILTVFSSCNNNSKTKPSADKDTSGTEYYVEENAALVSQLNRTFSHPVGENPITTNPGVSGTWAAFEVLFKACIENSSLRDKGLFSKYRLLYLGPSNSKYLGTIYSADGVVDRTELRTWLPEDRMKTFITKGFDVPNCDVSSVKDMALDFFIDWKKLDKQDTALRDVISKHTNIQVQSLTWTIDEIRTAELNKYLRENKKNNPDLAFYDGLLNNKNNITAIKIVKIKGIKIEIESSRKFNAALQAKLNVANPIKLKADPAATDSLAFGLKFSSSKQSNIVIESDGEFFAFALATKAKNF